MKTIYETQVIAVCPADKKPDVYAATFESSATIEVEDILAAIKEVANEKAFQETITMALARNLKCKVTTIGWHSGVKTTVVVP